ncbi:hypothetical protein R5R35_006171 [Gryllus longicercus]|uniref:MADF domain-containing protein n=1 Tax=Gryllus longicercus TaxID=2509291 RepID=A0AAN9VT04_9ORTH
MEATQAIAGTGETRWSKENITKLIELLELRECLWRKSHSFYKDRVKRNAALYEMSEQLARTPKEIENKIHNLRCQYRNEVKKERTRNSGAGAKDVYMSKWEFFKSLNFLYGGGEAEKGNTFDSMSKTSTELELDMESQETLLESQLAPSVCHYAVPSTSAASVTCVYGSPPKKKRDTSEDEVLKKCISVLDRHIDEHQVFGEHVASALRELPERLQCKLKIDISELIVNARKEHYNSMQ